MDRGKKARQKWAVHLSVKTTSDAVFRVAPNGLKGLMAHEYFVTKDGVPCKLAQTRFARKKTLIKCEVGEPAEIMGVNYSCGHRRAERMIDRT